MGQAKINEWRNNGYTITELHDACYLVWKDGEVIRAFTSPEIAERYTNDN